MRISYRLGVLGFLSDEQILFYLTCISHVSCECIMMFSIYTKTVAISRNGYGTENVLCCEYV